MPGSSPGMTSSSHPTAASVMAGLDPAISDPDYPSVFAASRSVCGSKSLTLG